LHWCKYLLSELSRRTNVLPPPALNRLPFRLTSLDGRRSSQVRQNARRVVEMQRDGLCSADLTRDIKRHVCSTLVFGLAQYVLSRVCFLTSIILGPCNIQLFHTSGNSRLGEQVASYRHVPFLVVNFSSTFWISDLVCSLHASVRCGLSKATEIVGSL
jgi:hypothetical protein